MFLIKTSKNTLLLQKFWIIIIIKTLLYVIMLAKILLIAKNIDQ